MDPVVKPVIPARILYFRQLEWIELNAKPRKLPKAPPIDRGPIFSNTARLQELAAPRYPYVKPRIPKLVADAALNCTASGRVMELAVAKLDRSIPKPPWTMPSPICPERIVGLSQPRYPYRRLEPKPLVSLKAMQCVASERVSKLAKPKERAKNEPYEYAFVVNPIAMKYFASKRTRAMARVPKVWTEADLVAQEAVRMKRKIAYDKQRAAKLAKMRKEVAERHKKQARSMGL